MLRNLLRLGAIAALSTLVVAACGGPAPTPTIQLSASPRTIDDKGQVSQVTAIAMVGEKPAPAR